MKESVSYLKHVHTSIIDGGGARNEAFYRYLNTRYHLRVISINNLHQVKPLRILAKMAAIIKFLCSRGNTYFLHLGGILTLFLPLYTNKLGWKIMGYVLRTLTKYNRVYIEINDLPYEQSIDLELDNVIDYHNFQEQLFSAKDAHFIFASGEMQSYSVKKYEISPSQCQVILNGAPKLVNDRQKDSSPNVLQGLDQQKTKYLYVGTLNRGRQIEELINAFDGVDQYLVLMGPEGEWISKPNSNILYLGAFSEDVAIEIASACDVGLIPYDEKRFYYNLCYPTKVSFYISAGLPILSTPLLETKKVLDSLDVAQFAKLPLWKDLIQKSSTAVWAKYKSNAINVSSQFQWKTLLEQMKLDLNIKASKKQEHA